MEIQNIINLLSKITSLKDFDDASIESNLKSVLSLDISSSDFNEYNNQSIRFSYVLKTTELLFRLKNITDLVLSVSQCATVSKCIEFIVSFGFTTCLIPRVWMSVVNKQKNVIQFTEDIPPNMKYEGLKFIVNSFLDLIKEPTLRRIIMVKHTNVLLAGLCQLCLLPIAKPGSKVALDSDIDELKYEKLINEQKTFKNILEELILTDRDPLIIREIIFIVGHKNCQKHLKLGLQKLLSRLLIQSNGIQTFLRVACDLSTETSQNFYQHGLQEWSNLIHSYYIKSKSVYIECIIPQVWDLLRSDTKFHQCEFRSVGVYCTHLMSIENYSDFLMYYIDPVDQLLNRCKLQKDDNTSVSLCIEDLHTLFYLFKNEIWSLKPKLLMNSAATIYSIYMATACGVYYLKNKLEDLIFLILIQFSNSKDYLKLIVFSPYQIDVEYDDNSGNIKIKYIERNHQLHLESQVDLILDLLDKRADSTLMKTIFIALLDMYTDAFSNEYSIMEKLFIVKAIHHLLEKDDVQKSISKYPETVLNMMKSILKKVSEDNVVDLQVLSIILMVLGCLLENINTKYINQLDCFLNYLQKIAEIIEDSVFKDMVIEIQQKIKQTQNNSYKQPDRDKRTIDDILYDTRDPLLPCRSHALIELKKMIESGDKTVLAKKSAILILLQENLKNVDSYMYLSAILTLSALCSFYPHDILPILCEEYSMPKTYNHSPETRLKIGEVLMKTIKNLNETIPMYKNRLLNTFMAGVRDDDHLVRASSLSNLADVCRLLRYNLGSIISEIINCAKYVLQFDSAVEPRRAAVLLLQMIIQGGDSELLEIVSGSLKDIYQMLKLQYESDKDEIIKLHAQVAIERLNCIMKSLLLNEKTIK